MSHGGSYPGYQTNTMLWLDGKVGVIVLTNADDGNPGGDRDGADEHRGPGRGQGRRGDAAGNDVGSVLVALCRPLSRPRRRFARRRVEQERW